MGVMDPFEAVTRPGRSGDSSQPIGTLSTQVACTARRVRRSSRQEVVFGPEEPISVGYRWRTVKLGGGREQGIWRLEVKDLGAAGAAAASEEDASPKGQGPSDWLTLAEAPYSNCWVGQAPFKRGSQKGGDERPSFEASSLDEALARLGELSHDFWEKGRRLTAGFTQPQLPFFSDRRPREPGKNALWVFGVCRDLEATVEELARSPAAHSLLEVDRVFHPAASGTAVGEDVHPRALEERNTLLLIAIKQALAGPTDQAWDNDGWIDRPVMELAGRIFRDHLYNRTRVERRKDRH